MTKSIDEGAPHKIIGIDDSGNPSIGGQICIFTAVQFCRRKDYMLWRKIVRKTIAENKLLKSDGEIKSSKMSLMERKKIFQKIYKQDIQFYVWTYSIDTRQYPVIRDYINNNEKGGKDQFTNRILDDFLQNCIFHNIKALPVAVEIDGKSKGNLKYNNISIKYKDSRESYRLQFADFIGSAVYGYCNKDNNPDVYIPLYEKYVKSRVLGYKHYP